jgi:hypothetical protein
MWFESAKNLLGQEIKELLPKGSEGDGKEK